MPKQLRIFGKRTGIIFIEILAAFAVVFILGMAVLTWRISSSPLDINYFIPNVEEALRDPVRGNHAKIETLFVHWPDLSGPILLDIGGAQVLNSKDVPIISTDKVAISLKPGPLMIGRVKIQALIIKSPSVDITRNDDGRFDIGIGGLQDAMPAANENSQDVTRQTHFVSRLLNYVSKPGEDSEDSSPLSALQRFEIRNASLVYDDPFLNKALRLEDVNVIFLSVEEGLAASLSVPFPKDKEFTGGLLSSKVLIPWDTHDIFVDLELQKFGLETLTSRIKALDGLRDQNFIFDMNIDAHFGPDLTLYKSDLMMQTADGALYIPYLSDQPLPYKDFIFDIEYDHRRRILDIQDLFIELSDLPVHASGSFGVSTNEISGPFRMRIDELEQARLAALWPDGLDEENAREWVVDKLSEGRFKDIFAEAELRVNKRNGQWHAGASQINSGFAFEGMSINYKAPLPAIENAKGRGDFSLEKDQLSISLETGKAGGLDIQSAEVLLTDVAKEGAGDATITIDLQGPLSNAISFLSTEPIGLDHDFDLNVVRGQGSARVQLDFPVRDKIPKDSIDIIVDGTLNDVFIPDIVSTLDLSKGPFKVSVAKNIYTISGKGALDGQPASLKETGFLKSEGKPHKSILNAQLLATEPLRAALGVDLDDFLSGPVGVDLEHKQINDRESIIALKLDLTPGLFFLSPFAYEKPLGIAGAATMTIFMKDDAVQEIQNLDVSAPSVSILNGRLVFQQKSGAAKISQARLPKISVGETVGALEVEVKPSGVYKIALDGAFLDLRPFLNSDDVDRDKNAPYDSPPIQASVSVDRMRAADDYVMRHGKIYIDIDDQGRFNQLELDAIAGQGDIYLRYKPDDKGVRTFRYESDDAGAALAAFGIYDKIRGGKMVIYGEPIEGVYDRNIVGLAEITNFKVVDAPTLARLLNAISLPGLLGLLDGEGIAFTKLEAGFDWLYRPKGSLLVLKKGRTSGSEVGLTFDGTFDNFAGSVDVSGTIIPLSTVNKIVGSIPVIGNIITGGTGSLIAATYTLKGKSSDPQVLVNPLSVLAPGILRRILFEN